MNKKKVSLTIKQDTRTEKYVVDEQPNLMDVLIEKSFFLVGACGRRGVCRTCLVEVDGKWQKACQTRLDKDTFVVVPAVGIENTANSVYLNQSHQYHLVLDIGTTTLVLYIVDQTLQEVVHEEYILNPQQSFGADVISRIAASKTNLFTMQKMITDVINQIIEKFEMGMARQLFVVGNTTMLHLFLGVDPVSIGEAPYQPVFLEEKKVKGSDLGIDIEEIIILPGKSAFIGADVISGVYLVKSRLEKKTSIYIDLGTNGEIVLHHQGKWYAASSAAGPAFEGACISCGTGGIAGAIDHIKDSKNWEYTTIANKEPIGICGSGLIACIAYLREEKIIDQYGMFKNPQKDFLLTDNIHITQEDVHQVQYAKSAVYSALLVLLDQANLDKNQVEEVLVAGGLGAYIQFDHAIRIGLFPEEWKNKIYPIGNASGYGAVWYSLQQKKDVLKQLIEQIKVIDLAGNSLFGQLFLEELIIR